MHMSSTSCCLIPAIVSMNVHHSLTCWKTLLYLSEKCTQEWVCGRLRARTRGTNAFHHLERQDGVPSFRKLWKTSWWPFCWSLPTLSAIIKLKTLASNAQNKARGYQDGLLRYETVLTAQIFLQIFEFTSPLSTCLQTGGMDIFSAHRMVITTRFHTLSMKKIARDFPGVKDLVDYFVLWENEKL